MFNSSILLMILAFITFQSYGQETCAIQNHYEDFISIQKATYNESSYLIKRTVESPKERCFSPLINSNTVFIDYLLTNFSSNANSEKLLQLQDSAALATAYFRDLRADSAFNSLMSELVDKTITGKTAKDTLSIDALLNIAVKYFSILKLTGEGAYVGKVCVGLNDIKKTESQRKPFVEAFCFSSILKHYRGEEFNLHAAFVQAIKELYKVNLGIDKAERLLRAQGAMFLLMRNNERLQKMLKVEYEAQKAYLPFVLAA